MNPVRRRKIARPHSQPAIHHDHSLKPEDPELEKPVAEDDGLELIPTKELHELHHDAHKAKKVKGTKRRIAWIFALGGLFGLLLAGVLANNNDWVDIASSFTDLNLDQLLDVLPAGFINEAKQFQVREALDFVIFEANGRKKHEKDTVAYDSFAVGLAASAQGIKAKHPVVMIPGVISTGLESWAVNEDIPSSKNYFRKRLWGSWSMMRALITDKAGWKRHIMLDTETGLDPPGVKLRAAQGFDAADFFITGYWIWNKILENLATIGYDPTNAFTAAYDWRLTYADYEVRDQYFSRLKMHIEMAVKMSGNKTALLSHSMGSQVLYYFFHWVEAQGDGYGNGGPTWVADHVDSWINISGCMLGAVKGLTAVLSGEMRDTAQLNSFAVFGLEKFLGRGERVEIFRAMPGISSMLPMGGDEVWGNTSWAPDDKEGQSTSYGRFIRFHDGHFVERNVTDEDDHVYANLTVSAALPFLLEQADDWYGRIIRRSYSHGVAHTKKEVEANQKDPKKWVNPLETRLPMAPDLKIFCFYGVGKPTERAYVYRSEPDPFLKINVTIDTGYSTTDGLIDHGVLMGEGDGTVSLLSMGYMCSKGWKIKRYNPSGAKVRVHEMEHEPDRFSARGGPNTGMLVLTFDATEY
jgi:phospholipid:diacylglycerol acyltransferase